MQTLSILVKGAAPAKWELITTVNYFKGNKETLKIGNYRRLKSIDHIMNIVKRNSKTKCEATR